MLSMLSRAHAFEERLATRYQSVKRFGIEGGEALIVGLNEMLARASHLGVTQVVMGMSHRGRLNVLANVAAKPVEAILYEFRGSAAGTLADQKRLREQSDRAFGGMDLDDHGMLTVEALHCGLQQMGIDVTPEEAGAALALHDVDATGNLNADEFFALALKLLGRNYSGDVKYHLRNDHRPPTPVHTDHRPPTTDHRPPTTYRYHLGTTTSRDVGHGRSVTLSMLPNPSHLEAVNPLVVGLARAKQLHLGDRGRTRVLPLLLHGDAAFAAQGVVYETIGLSNLYGYTTGGALHLVVNNQIGFTTSPGESRSSRYCTDVAKAVGAPIFHVNGDDVEAVVRACRLATDFRQRFGKDVVIDLVCYRRHGHQEADNPMFTQPQMYQAITAHPTTLATYSEVLVSDGVLSADECEQIHQERPGAPRTYVRTYMHN